MAARLRKAGRGGEPVATVEELQNLMLAQLVCQHPGCNETEHLEVDHIAPFSTGGASTIDNLQMLCLEHNIDKGDRWPDTQMDAFSPLPRKRNTSGFRWVSWDKRRHNWRWRVERRGVTRMGHAATPEAAHALALEAAKKLYQAPLETEERIAA